LGSIVQIGNAFVQIDGQVCIKRIDKMNITKPMIGKICMVTGANAGIGKSTALVLGKMGATVVMICRNRERGEAALNEIKRVSGNDNVSLLLADLSSQNSIRQLVENFKTQYTALHVLINNAGNIPKERTITEDGIETQFAVSHLAYFLLTNLLLDVLKASAPSRIINVASTLHQFATISFDDLQSEHSYQPSQVYNRTKLANILFTYELARRLCGTQVTANCLHPGVTDTKLLSDFVPIHLRFLVKIISSSPEKGAQTSIYLATSPDVENVSGKYFVKRKAVRSSKASYDETTAHQLWQVSAELTGLSV
jgi:NAD(P)-dependent dehydrogenase (short-subunit alcohol dehydrogenase family)